MTLEQLKTCRRIKNELELLSERITRLRSAMERITVVLKRDGSGFGSAEHDKLGAQMAELDERERALADRVLAFERLAEEVDCWLDTLPYNQRIIMRLRYVEGLKWRQVAKKARFSLQACYKIHSQALERVE